MATKKTKPVNPIPDGYPRVIPYLHVKGAQAAIEFYEDVLGAKERMRMPGPDGKIGHAELAIGDGLIMLADEFPDMGAVAPSGNTGGAVMVYLPDVDAAFARAVARGATVTQPVTDQFYGDRSGQFTDPFGHCWNVSTHTEDVAPDEMERRMAAMMQGG
jgi:PhnB protein